MRNPLRRKKKVEDPEVVEPPVAISDHPDYQEYQARRYKVVGDDIAWQTQAGTPDRLVEAIQLKTIGRAMQKATEQELEA